MTVENPMPRMFRTVAAAAALVALLAAPIGATPVRGGDEVQDPAARAAEIDPRGAAYAHLMRATLAVKRGESREAADEIERAVELQPESSALRIEAAELLRRLGRRQDARDMGRQALELDPDSPRALRFLGDLAAEKALAAARPSAESRDEALGYYARLMEMGDVDGEVLWKVAGLRLQGGDRLGAIDAAQVLVELRPGDRGAAGSLAKWLLEEGRDAEALDVVLDYVVSHPDDDVFIRLADDLARRNDRWQAVADRLGPEAGDGLRSAEAQQLVSEALFRTGHGDEALRALERALDLDPDDAELRFRLANALRESGRLADAVTLAQALVDSRPDERDGWLLLAEIRRSRADIDGAIDAYRAALDLAIGEGREAETGVRDAIRIRIAGAQLAADRIDEAGRTAAGLEVADAPEAVELRVQIALRAEDWGAAQREAIALRELGQAGFAALVEGEILLGSDRDDAAAERFDSALEVLGDRIRPRVAALWTDAGREQRAIDAVEAWIASDPADATVRFQAGALFHDLGLESRSEEELFEAVRLDPTHAPALNYLGYSLAERGERLDEALSMIRSALEVDPSNGAYLDSLGWALFRLGRYDEARDPLERAAREYPFDPTVLDHLGDLYREIGEPGLAVAAWRRAIDAGAETPERIREKAEAVERAAGAGTPTPGP